MPRDRGVVLVYASMSLNCRTARVVHPGACVSDAILLLRSPNDIDGCLRRGIFVGLTRSNEDRQVVVCAMVTVYACEAFLAWDPLELRGPHPQKGFDLREDVDVVRDFRARGVWAYHVFPITMWSDSPPTVHDMPTLPLSGVPLAVTVVCNETGTYLTRESDRFGFNNPDEQWDRPVEVALVGDSFAEGWCVPREQSFAGLIRHAIPATLNVGYTSHGPLAELGTLREYIEPRHPAHVFWFFYEGNDLTTDLSREMKSDILRRYLEPGFNQHLGEHAVELGEDMRRLYDARLANLEPTPASSWLMGIAKLRTSRALINAVRARQNSHVEQADGREDLRRILAEAKRTVEEWGGSLHFVYLPDFFRVIGEGDPTNHDRVLALAADLGLPIIDLLPDFAKHPSPRSLFPYEEARHLVRTRGVHYNAAGHRLVAQRIIDVMDKN